MILDDELVSMLYGILGVSIVDGDRLRVLGAVAGPAGSSAMDLPDGGVWEVDHIDPSIPVRFDVPLAGADRSPLLIAAFGGDGALYLADQAVDPTDDGAEPDVVAHRPKRGAYDRGSGHRRPDDPDLMAGRVVVLHEMATDGRSVPLVQIAAVTELLLKAYAVSGGELLLSVLPSMRDMAGGLADQVTDDELEALGPRLASRLASALARVAGTGRGTGSTLIDLAGRTRDIARSTSRPMALVADDFSTRDERSPVVLMIDRADTGRSNPTLDRADDRTDEYLDVHRPTPTVLEVAVARSDRRRWIRVTHHRGSIPLAQAPLRRRDLIEVADLIVPPDVPDDDLRIEVIDPEDVHAIDGRPAELIRRAVELGREAARQTRVHGPSAAAMIWRSCAEVWQIVGDVGRAELARSMVDDNGSGPHLSPYLADEVALALAR